MNDRFVRQLEDLRWQNVRLYVAVFLRRIANEPRYMTARQLARRV